MRKGRLVVGRHPVRATTLLACLAAAAALPAVAGAEAGSPHRPAPVAVTPITWLAAGDSYSSGQGLTKTTGPCARGESTTTSLAYPVQAYDDLRLAMPELKAPNFTACSGAVTANFFSAGDAEHLPEWRPAKSRYELVTFTFGGNTVDFSGVVAQCVVGSLDEVHASAPGHKCPDDSWVRQLISEKLGTPYVAFLRRVAETAVAPGGNVVVLGYPDLIAAPATWPAADRSADSCDGIVEADAVQLRGDAGDLNATIGHDVAVVNAAHPNGVHLSFLNVNNGGQVGTVAVAPNDPYLFEPSTGGSHNLCGAGTAWMNGVELPDLSRSFHPSLPGYVAEGRLLAQVLPHLDWSAGGPSPGR